MNKTIKLEFFHHTCCEECSDVVAAFLDPCPVCNTEEAEISKISYILEEVQDAKEKNEELTIKCSICQTEFKSTNLKEIDAYNYESIEWAINEEN